MAQALTLASFDADAHQRATNTIPHQSHWHREGCGAKLAVFQDQPTDSDIVIVGGGLAGLSTAISILEQAPRTRVTVLESRFVGFGASGRAGGLMSPLAAPVWLLSADRNPEHAWAIRTLRTMSDRKAAWLAEHIPEAEVRAEQLAIEATGPLTGLGLTALSGILTAAGVTHDLKSAAKPTQRDHVMMACHTVNPFGTVHGLARHARTLGAAIHEGTNVAHISDDADGATITLGNGRFIRAGTVVMCTNAYTKSVGLPEQPKAKVVSNFMIASKPLDKATQAVIAKSGIFTVELNGAYVFYRLHGGRLLFGGIEKFGDMKGGSFDVPPQVLSALEALLAKSFPGVAPIEIDRAWGGKFHMTLTDLPIIHRTRRAGTKQDSAIVMNVGYGGTGIALTLALSAQVAAIALRNPSADRDNARLHAVMQTTRLPLTDLARHASAIAWRVVKSVVGVR